jgi:hypothetical protein
MRDESLPVAQAVETTVIEQKQILERGREKVDVREFYEWAQAGGIEDAKERIETLK